jgi:acyl carrier protein
MASLPLRGQIGGNAAVSLPVPDQESSIQTRAEFELALIRFINEILPEIHQPLKVRLQVSRSTLLFESGLIDSLAILHLIGFVEKATGRPVPPRKVVMKFFRSVENIAQSFYPEKEE